MPSPRTQLLSLCFFIALLVLPSTAFAVGPPPQLGQTPILSSSGAQINPGWNYFKVDNVPSGTCSVKNIMDELQADGGAALTLDSLFISSDGGNTFKLYTASDPLSSSTKISADQILSFESNQKLFFNLDPKNCSSNPTSNPSQDRLQQIENIRQESHGSPASGNNGSGLLDQLLSVPKTFWQNILGVVTPPTPTQSTPSSDNLEVENLTSSSLNVTKKLSIGLLSLDPLEESLSSLSTLKIQPDSTLGGVDFLSGKVTIDQNGTLGITKLSASGGIVGSGVLAAGQTKVNIQTSSVTSSSKIFITPTTLTDKTLVVSGIEPGKDFSVEITSPANSDITFNWWVVDAQ